MFAYFDETGVSGGAEHVTAVAGYLFSTDGAQRFREIFAESVLPLLPADKHGKRIFHAAQCIGGYKPFDRLRRPERERIASLMVDAITQSAKLGVVTGAEPRGYTEALARSPGLSDLAGTKYSVCLITCIENIGRWLDQEQTLGKVTYVF